MTAKFRFIATHLIYSARYAACSRSGCSASACAGPLHTVTLEKLSGCSQFCSHRCTYEFALRLPGSPTQSPSGGRPSHPSARRSCDRHQCNTKAVHRRSPRTAIAPMSDRLRRESRGRREADVAFPTSIAHRRSTSPTQHARSPGQPNRPAPNHPRPCWCRTEDPNLLERAEARLVLDASALFHAVAGAAIARPSVALTGCRSRLARRGWA